MASLPPESGTSWQGDFLVVRTGALLPPAQCGACGGRQGVTFTTARFHHDPEHFPLMPHLVHAVVTQVTRRWLELKIPLCPRCRFGWDWAAPLTALTAIGGGVPVFLAAKEAFVENEGSAGAMRLFWALFIAWVVLTLAGAVFHCRSRWRCRLIEDGGAIFSYRRFGRLRRQGLWGMPPEREA